MAYIDRYLPQGSTLKIPFHCHAEGSLAGNLQWYKIWCGKPAKYGDTPYIWRLLQARFLLACDANVDNRVIVVGINQRASVGSMTIGQSGNIAANESKYLQLSGFIENDAVATDDFQGYIDPNSNIMWDDGNLDVRVTNGKAGDVLTLWTSWQLINELVGSGLAPWRSATPGKIDPVNFPSGTKWD